MYAKLIRQRTCLLVLAITAIALANTSGSRLSWGESPDGIAALEADFQELPVEARRLTGPLFWLHGDESPERLERYLEIVADGGNGCFTAESRPHIDWLGPGWYRDLGICLQKAKELDLHMWIFDEKWWPSGEVGGKVPQQYGSKFMRSEAVDVDTPGPVSLEIPEDRLIAVLAGQSLGEAVDGDTLIDLTDRVDRSKLNWDAPEGDYRVMVFTWEYSEGRHGRRLVDGASQEAVDWYLETVYQPHYDHFAEDFGKTIRGYFYDEPETIGDWGTEVIPELKRQRVDWKKALVAWKFHLADEDEQTAAEYQYRYAFAEAWGRTLYGGITRWCHEHDVLSIGHWLEHRHEYLHPLRCAGDMVQVQKYSDMGGIDAVFKQFVPGLKDDNTYQTPKLGSSISHAYGKKDDLTMVEIFGARGQDLSYPEMKWWTDLMHVAGVNFHIPHSFNPRSPFDRDCPPYFYNSGFEPRWPLYQVYADYTTRLSLLLSGGRHVCPVAFLYLGQSYHVGEAITPENMTTALQDALFDCDWIPYDVFLDNISVEEHRLHLRDERYRVLVVPAAEVVPYAVMQKVKAFYDAGGVVIGYGILPQRSATLGYDSADIAALRTAVWGNVYQPSLEVCATNDRGGRAYFLPAEPTSTQIQQVLTGDAGIHPTLEVLSGETDDWLHVLHRVKEGADVFLICNQQHEGEVKHFRFRAQAAGVPECWDALRNERRALEYQRVDESTVDFSLRLYPLQSMLVVFRQQQVDRPALIVCDEDKPIGAVEVERVPTPPELVIPNAPPVEPEKESPLVGCRWVWYPEEKADQAAAPGTRYFRKTITLPNEEIEDAGFSLTADNSFTLFVNGEQVGSGHAWETVTRLPLTDALKPGENVLAIAAANATDEPNPAGLIGFCEVQLADGRTITSQIDTSWKAADSAPEDWQQPGFDDGSWGHAREVVAFGGGPWGTIDDRRPLTVSPVESDPFCGTFDVPEAWFDGTPIYLETGEIEPEGAASVTVNGEFAGGFIGRPFRLDITRVVRAGRNRLVIEPFSPEKVRVVRYGK